MAVFKTEVSDGAAPDLLGARSDTVDVESITRWNLTQFPDYDDSDVPDAEKPTHFPWRNDLNAKIVLWDGDLTKLNVHAIINTTNETFTDKNPVSEYIYEQAGPKLRLDLKVNIKGCKTGEAKVTKAYDLLARYVIHTVCPKYNQKYITAAESALYSCYRATLQLCRENGIRIVALSNIHTHRRGYPAEDASHIAIRTVRRFLENFGECLDLIVFLPTEEGVLEAYRKVLPLYFPRSKQEEYYAVQNLSSDVGNEFGEPVIADRQIRIIDKPMFAAYKKNQEDFEETIDLKREFMTSTAVDIGHHPFAKMEGDLDKKKLSKVRASSSVEHARLERKKRYERFLKRAGMTDLTAIAQLRCLYQSGTDKYGRAVIIIVGKCFPAKQVDLEKALMYFIHVMDPIVEKDYIIVYFHTLTTPENRPDMSFMKDSYTILDSKYKRHLRAFYIIHPTFWSKLATWFFTTFAATGIKEKVHSLNGVQYLYGSINPDQLDVPNFVFDHDLQINGPRYYVPADNGEL